MFRKRFHIIILAGVVFILRLALSFLPSFEIDMNAWLGWANRLNEIGPANFYSDSVWTQYTPGFLYWLLVIGKLGVVNSLAVKIPIILADIVLGLLLYKILLKKSSKWAIFGFLAYVANPTTIFNGSIWGQIDGILALFLVLSVYFLLEKKVVWAGVFWALAFLIKPQAVALAPLLAILLIRNFSIKKWLYYLFTVLAVVLVLSFPFFPTDPFLGLFKLISKMGGYYAYTSVFAFNFWSLIGMWKADSKTFLGISYFVWGTALYGLAVISLLAIFWKRLKKKAFVYLFASLLFFSFFLFPTRVHERYLFPALPFLLIAAGLTKERKLLGGFVATSMLMLVNIYHPYAYYDHNFLVRQDLLSITSGLTKAVAVGFLAVFSFFLVFDKVHFAGLPETKLKTKPFLVKHSKKILLLILTFSTVARFVSLGSPHQEYFDEVYHAFTAKVILHGDPKAWEWWNTPPEGFAYEWTHPPMAKLIMVAGMSILGESPIGWRAPAALFGVGCIYLVYLLTHKIFEDDLTALLSTAVFALDGLPLVMSRIGMNDIYFLFFALLSLYFFITEKNLFSAAALGFAAASKWTVAWLMPVLALSFFVFKKKIKPSLVWFSILPPLIYLASYLPMFVTGHTWSQFVEMQKQMWWYHTGLKATHAYQSSAVTWPFMVRPVWLYTSGRLGGLIANIYATGNPFIFWMGLVSAGLCLAWALQGRIKKLAFVVFAYLAFFVPWIGSPRIMFLYHYLPSIPFLAILAGYTLRRFPKLAIGFVVLAFVSFIYFFPHWSGIKVPVWLDNSYYWLSSWK